jgi:hypothetical protein
MPFFVPATYQVQLIAWMGLIVVPIALLASFAAANANAVFFLASKATREAAGAGNALVVANLLRRSQFPAGCI